MSFKASENFPVLAKVWIILTLIACFSGFIFETPSLYAKSNAQKIKEIEIKQRSIERQKQYNQKKIETLKKQEYGALQQLRSTQYKLDAARSSLRDQQYRLTMARNNIDKLEQSLVKLNNDKIKLKTEASKRIRQIYKGERISLFHMILGVKDITSFLDRLYYQQRMIQRDKEILEELKEKTQELAVIRERLQNQKDTIISTINSIESQKKEIAITVDMNKNLVNELKTNRQAYERAQNQLIRDGQDLARMITDLTPKDPASSKVSYAKGGFLKPVAGYVSSPYGYRRHPIFGGRRFHSGVDIAGKNRSPILASNDGKVLYTGWKGGYGKVVIIDHGQRLATLYAHMSSINVSKGQMVKKGQIVGREGSTGYSTGPHLHFEVHKNGQHTNPMNYIR